MLSDVIAAVRRKDFTNLNCLLQYGIVDTHEDSLESASQIQTTKSVIDHLIDDKGCQTRGGTGERSFPPPHSHNKTSKN